MRLALLSNVTVDLLAGMVKKTHEVYLSAGFDTWQQEMIMPTSGLYEFKPEAIIVLLLKALMSGNRIWLPDDR